jgi:hypothetical protein
MCLQRQSRFLRWLCCHRIAKLPDTEPLIAQRVEEILKQAVAECYQRGGRRETRRNYYAMYSVPKLHLAAPTRSDGAVDRSSPTTIDFTSVYSSSA